MRQFPQVTLILLLFLIAALLGSLVWLQWTAHLDANGQESARRSDSPRGGRSDRDITDTDDSADGSKEPGQPTGGPGGRAGRPEGGNASDTVDVGATVSQEPRRAPPDAERKPDLEKIARDEAKAIEDARRLANLEATFARGAIAEQSRDGLDLNARIVWAVPPHSTMGSVTASFLNAHYCGPFEKHPQAAKEAARRLGKKSVSAKEVRDLFAEEWVLVGRVALPPAVADQADAWAGLDKPPIIVNGLGRAAVANAEGWFALPFQKKEWTKGNLWVDADFPGFEVANAAGELVAVSLADKPENQGAVTLSMVPVSMLSVRVDCKPVLSVQSGLRAWLEVRRARPEGDVAPLNYPVLFLEADVPPSGQITFILPDPRTWNIEYSSGASIRVGAAGDGWASGTPTVITNWDSGNDLKSRGRDGVKFLGIKTVLSMERASTDLVTGRFLVGTADDPGSPVRVESSHTGAVTWSDPSGNFRLWTQLDRGNWKQKLVIEPTYAAPFGFFIDYDTTRPPNVELRRGGSAPAGPWDIKLPPRAGGMMYLSVPRARAGIDIYLETTEGWTPLLLTRGLNGTRLLLCSNWPAWYGQAVIVDRETGRIQRAKLEKYQVSDEDFPYGRRAVDANGEPVGALKVTVIDE